MRRLLLIAFCALCAGLTAAQDDALTTENVEIVARADAFGVVTLAAEGDLSNTGETGYTRISLFAEVYDARDMLIGEGFGYPVTECGEALLSHFVLNPDHTQAFSVSLELYDDYETIEDALDAIDRVDIVPQFEETEPTVSERPQLDGIVQISDQEVVALEWLDERSVLFGVGCANAVFTELDWYDYTLNTRAAPRPTEHPDAQFITETFLRVTGINQRTQTGAGEDPSLYFRSFLTPSPTARRIIYQNDLNVLISAEPDGSFRRIIDDNLYRNSLQGFVWLPEGRFVAYYFGAYGEPVQYITATVDGQRYSAGLSASIPSFTVPGGTDDARRVIITAEIDGVTGYYLRSVVNTADIQLLFETDEYPGNNWPAPLWLQTESNDAFIYLAREIDGEARLQCFNMQDRELSDLAPLPLRLTDTERAWWWLSPDRATIALGANGVEGGLWAIDLSEFDCA